LVAACSSQWWLKTDSRGLAQALFSIFLPCAWLSPAALDNPIRFVQADIQVYELSTMLATTLEIGLYANAWMFRVVHSRQSAKSFSFLRLARRKFSLLCNLSMFDCPNIVQ
jgi:hypothetical protein